MKGITQLGPQPVEAQATAPVVDKKAFAKQLEKARPAVKKPEVTPDVAPQPAAPDQPSLVQVLAALLNGATPQPQSPDAVVAEAAKPALAQAAEVATVQVADSAKDALLQQMVAVEPEVATLAPAEPPLTPLEQAVHDLLSELADKPPTKSDGTQTFALQLAPAPTIAPIDEAPQVAQAAPVQAQTPAELVSQNHAHLVFDDANGRVVMTVAVRGSDVNVSVRASDDATAAALARNAGSLDQAMRGRGLALAQFDSQRDLAREQNQDKPTYPREREPKRQNKRFSLEENQ
ncbi:MAG: flagellar hook-length control protein FliK [Kofleriaceae bacterium]